MDNQPHNPQGGPGKDYNSDSSHPNSSNGPYHNPYQNGPGNTGPYGSGPYNNPYGPYGMPQQPVPLKTKGDGMASVSLILGIITLGSLLLLRISMPFLLGSVGIVLAILSKGGARKMIGKAKAGMICCITGLALDVAFCVFAVWLVFSLPKLSPDLTEEVNRLCEEQYGVSYDEMMQDIYDMWDFSE